MAKLGKGVSLSESSISIIVSIGKNSSYVPRCLDSILAQKSSLNRLEVILVDDGWSRESALICDYYADDYSETISKIEGKDDSVLADPRNYGIEKAKGDYILFMNSQECLGDEALGKMLRYATEWNSDVLLLSEDVSEIEEKSQLMERCSKVNIYSPKIAYDLSLKKLFRKDLLITHDISFSDNRYPVEPSFVLKTYFSSEIVSAVSDYAYYCHEEQIKIQNSKIPDDRCDKPWSKTEPRLAALQAMLDMVETYANKSQAGVYYKIIFDTYVKDIIVLALRKSTESIVAHDLEYVRGLLKPYYSFCDKSFDCKNVIDSLMENDSVSNLRTTCKTEKRVGEESSFFPTSAKLCENQKTLSKRKETSLLRRRFPKIYRVAAKKQHTVQSNKIYLIEPCGQTISPALSVLHKKLLAEYTFDVEVVFLHEDFLYSGNFLKETKQIIKNLAVVKYLFVSTRSKILECLPIRADSKLVLLPSVCSLDNEFLKGCLERTNEGFRGDYSLITVGSPKALPSCTKAFGLSEQNEVVQSLGINCTDIYYDYDWVDSERANIEKRFPQSKDKKIILFAPTLEHHNKDATTLNKFNIHALRDLLEDTHVLLLKSNADIDAFAVPETCQEFAFKVDSSTSIESLLAVADVAIFDSLTFAFFYSLTKRPMVFFVYGDKGGCFFDGLESDRHELSRLVFESCEDIAQYVNSIKSRFDIHDILAFSNYMADCDGYSTERIIEYIFDADKQKYRKSFAPIKLIEEDPEGVDVSVIIPSYNGLPEMISTLRSAIYQVYDTSRMEIIVVDDRSTDDSWEVLQGFARRYPDLFVVKQLEENSGMAGKPRNTGIDLARGKYVVFLDDDDLLAPEALMRLTAHAVDWNPNVMHMKVRIIGGGVAAAYTHNQPEADPYGLSARSFGPWKFCSRKFILEKNIRFGEIGFPEDTRFAVSLIAASETVSIASDYFFYVRRQRENLAMRNSYNSYSKLERWFVMEEELFNNTLQYLPPADRDKYLGPRVFTQIFHLLNSMVKNLEGEEREAYYTKLKHLVTPLYQQSLYERVSFERRIVLDAALLGDLNQLDKVVKVGVHEVIKGLRITRDEEGTKAFFSNEVLNIAYDNLVDIKFTSTISMALPAVKDALILAGTVESPLDITPDYDTLKIDLMLCDASEQDNQIVLTCAIDKKGPFCNTASSTYQLAVWHVKIDFMSIHQWAKDLPPSQWIFSLIIAWEGFTQTIRIGKAATSVANKQFDTLDYVLDDIRYRSKRTKRGSYRIKTSMTEKRKISDERQ